MDKTLVFDIWADYAHFKKYYTTTSPLTFSIPPKTTIYGIISAILGFSKDKYLDYFKPGKCKIAIKILKPIKKTRISLNLINTKKDSHLFRIKGRTQIRTEYLKDVRYRIYFMHEDKEIYQELKNNLKEHKCIYTISLGLSENLANFKFIEELEAEKINNDNCNWQKINSVIRVDSDNIKKGDIKFGEEEKEYFTDKIALEMKTDREVTEYGQILFERKGKSIQVNPNQYYRLSNKEKIIYI